MDLAWLSLAALIAVVVISCFSRVNPGVVAIALAWGIVLVAGMQAASSPQPAGNVLDVKTLVAGFPADLFLTLLGVSLLFAQAEVNGTLARVATTAQALCRGNRALIPIMFFLFAAVLGSVGPGNIAVAGLVAPVAMAAAVRLQISPLLMAIMVGHGAIASTVSPLTAAGATSNRIMAGMGLGNHEWEVFGYNAAANAIAAAVGFSLFGGWRLFARREAETDDKREKVAEKKAPLDWRHYLTIAVVAALVLAVVAFKVNIGLGAFVGAVVLSVFQGADEKEAFSKVPWSVIVMVCGVSLLTALLDKTGGTTRFAGLITTVSTPSTASPVLAFITGLVSIYSSTTGVVLPAFLPMVKELAAAQPGTNPLSLALSVLVGGNLVDMSPLSTIGALCLAGNPASVDRKKLFNELFAWGFVLAFVGAALCWLWFG
jgi:di/tricarboxylate transporter